MLVGRVICLFGRRRAIGNGKDEDSDRVSYQIRHVRPAEAKKRLSATNPDVTVIVKLSLAPFHWTLFRAY